MTLTGVRRARCVRRKRRTTIAISRSGLVAGELDERSSRRCARLLPNCRIRKRFGSAVSMGFSAYDAGVLTASRELADYYEASRQEVPKDPSWRRLGDG